MDKNDLKIYFNQLLKKAYDNLIEKLKSDNYTKRFFNNNDFLLLIEEYENNLVKIFEFFVNEKNEKIKNRIKKIGSFWNGLLHIS
ncbi:hypothetical protein [Lebetimonas sp. JH292]|uniref:hypothetical protein n=1 Tax=Lebetimonas sp. JH292 TaxID=990068 RepID=UPI000467CEE9|nr:hypothetical protein [Lebetimonas sp. JH292]